MILFSYILIPAPPDHQLSPTQVLTLNQSLRRIRDGVGRISTEHKDLHSSVSKVGKTIDRVRNFFFNNSIVPLRDLGISPMGYSGCLPSGKPAVTESHYPTYGACWLFLCFHNPPNSDMDCRIFNVYTDVTACDCTQGVYRHRKRVCTER